MKRLKARYSCNVELALEFVGGKWKTVILAWLKEGPHRYGDLRAKIPGISEKVLTERLKDLERLELVEKVRGGDAGSATLYRLSPRGESLRPVLGALYDWGLAAARELPVTIGGGLRPGAHGTELARQQARGGKAAMPFYERGDVRIHYQEAGSGFPLLVLPGGGLNSTMANLARPFDPLKAFADEYRCITLDLRNAKGGQSSGPLEVARPWDSYTDDHLGLMDHLGIDRFLVLGFCIGGPFIWNMLRRAPGRIPAAVLAQPSGSRPEMRDLFYENNMANWGPPLCAQRPDVTMATVDAFLTRMYRTDPDFVFTVSRDFVRDCQTPVLILPDDVPSHPYAVAMEAAMLAPNAQVSLYPWKDPPERIPLAVRHIRSFLRAHRPR